MEASSPFLTKLDYFYQTQERLYYVMPFIGGGTLTQVLNGQPKGRFTERQIKFYVIQLVNGIQYLHNNNIMHRDLKLENLLLDETGYLKIVDYGMARVLRCNQTSYEMAGTPAYFAPELIKGHGHAYPADWWAVGTIMYQMLTGVLPFHNRNVARQNQQITDAELEIPNKVRIDHSDHFADIVNAFLTKEPDERLGSDGGANEIFEHAWFRNRDTEEDKANYIDIEDVLQRRMRAPIDDSFYERNSMTFFNAKLMHYKK